MRLMIISMPAIALAAILSVNIQRSIGYTTEQTEKNSAALPEASRIIERQVNQCNILRRNQGLPLIQLYARPSQLSDSSSPEAPGEMWP